MSDAGALAGYVRNARNGRASTCERRGRNRAGSPQRPKTFRHCATRSIRPPTVSGALWLSYMFVFLYLAIAAGAVTHKDLFFENPVKLPFLNVELPLIGFFVLGPALFLIVHWYTLLHFALLAGKVGAFHTELEAQIHYPETRARLRRQLPSNIFVQFLAGPRDVRYGVFGVHAAADRLDQPDHRPDRCCWCSFSCNSCPITTSGHVVAAHRRRDRSRPAVDLVAVIVARVHGSGWPRFRPCQDRWAWSLLALVSRAARVHRRDLPRRAAA